MKLLDLILLPIKVPLKIAEILVFTAIHSAKVIIPTVVIGYSLWQLAAGGLPF